jgi:hypothetical protein
LWYVCRAAAQRFSFVPIVCPTLTHAAPICFGLQDEKLSSTVPAFPTPHLDVNRPSIEAAAARPPIVSRPSVVGRLSGSRTSQVPRILTCTGCEDKLATGACTGCGNGEDVLCDDCHTNIHKSMPPGTLRKHRKVCFVCTACFALVRLSSRFL